MKIIEGILRYIKKYFFNPEWRCLVCGREIFEGESVCSQCEKELPKNDKYICGHCGRKTERVEDYCLTCKNVLTSVDLGRSCFVYSKPISTLVKKLKYGKARYIVD